MGSWGEDRSSGNVNRPGIEYRLQCATEMNIVYRNRIDELEEELDIRKQRPQPDACHRQVEGGWICPETLEVEDLRKKVRALEAEIENLHYEYNEQIDYYASRLD